ncbi:MAG: phenylacetate--CoA ligase family protein [Tissierellia bacterium]|nr:phenylacetate--CoA ligase family protein [Tissierellia bacterium]
MLSFYEKWIRGLVLEGDQPFTREAIETYQLKKLKETLFHARDKSSFYSGLLGDLDVDGISSLEDFAARVPFTYPEDLARESSSFLCLAQHEIARIITIRTSGTKEEKRIYFTEGDLERTVDFFHHGMAYLVKPGQKVLVLMPGNYYGSIGDLLKKGLSRLGCEALVLGVEKDNLKILTTIKAEAIDSIVGQPQQLYQLARLKNTLKDMKDLKLESILLSADYVAGSIKEVLEEAFNCRVFNHYGMSEMGYGGAVDCGCLEAYHLREADLYFEIIDPISGQVLPPGQEGEVVFTSLTREAMPLIRYRTGDRASFLEDGCQCSSILKRMGHIKGRYQDFVTIDGCPLSIGVLDEALFRLDNLLDYRASLKGGRRLILSLRAVDETRPLGLDEVIKAMEFSPYKALLEKQRLELELGTQDKWESSGNTMVKRALEIVD